QYIDGPQIHRSAENSKGDGGDRARDIYPGVAANLPSDIFGANVGFGRRAGWLRFDGLSHGVRSTRVISSMATTPARAQRPMSSHRRRSRTRRRKIRATPRPPLTAHGPKTQTPTLATWTLSAQTLSRARGGGRERLRGRVPFDPDDRRPG